MHIFLHSNRIGDITIDNRIVTQRSEYTKQIKQKLTKLRCNTARIDYPE